MYVLDGAIDARMPFGPGEIAFLTPEVRLTLTATNADVALFGGAQVEGRSCSPAPS